MGELMHSDEHASVDRLLPWFVNRTLEPDEHERVRHHLEGCEACREAVSLLSAVQSTVRHATATPMVPPPRTDRLLEAIDSARTASRRPRLSTMTTLAASLAAALLAGGLLVSDRENTERQPARYETATSGARPAAMDYVLEVRFERDTPRAARTRLLQALEARHVSEVEPDGAYRVTVSLPAASLEELETYLRDIEALPDVQSAAVIALQLPVKRER